MSLVRKYRIWKAIGYVDDNNKSFFKTQEHIFSNLIGNKNIYDSNGVYEELIYYDYEDRTYFYYYIHEKVLFYITDDDNPDKDKLDFFSYLYSKYFKNQVNSVEW